MPISIAVPYQNSLTSGSYISVSYTANSGLLLMASVVHSPKTYISSITWDGISMNPIVDYSYIGNEYQALSIYGLYNFPYGTKNFQCSIPGTTNIYVALLAFNQVGATYNYSQGTANPGTSALVSKTVVKNYPSNDMGMMVCSAVGSLTGIGSSGSIIYSSSKQQAQYGINASNTITFGQYTTGADPLYVTWITLALQEYVPPPPSEVYSPIWIY